MKNISVGSLVRCDSFLIGIVVEKMIDTEVFYKRQSVSQRSTMFRIYIPKINANYYRFEEQVEVLA